MERIRKRSLSNTGWLALLLGAVCFFFAPVNVMAKNPDKLLMAISPDAQFMGGHWYLTSQPFAVVKADLESGLGRHGLRGFQGRDDSAPLLDMEFYWTWVSLLHRPDIQQLLSAQTRKKTQPLLERSLAGGVITPEECDVFERAIREQLNYDKDALQSLPFFSQRIARWSFYRKNGRSKKFDEVMGIVMDVSPMLARSPVTLVWFNGWKTVTTSRFQWSSQMTGVTGFLAPHFEHLSNVKEDLDPSLVAYFDAAARRMQALSDDVSEQAMKGYLIAYKPMDVLSEQERIRESSIDSVQLDGNELPADESHSRFSSDKDWRMVALPDGSVLVSGDRSHRFVRRDNQVQRTNDIPELASVKALKIDPSGMVWGYTKDGVAGRRFLSWQTKTGSSRSYALPEHIGDSVRGNDWTVVPGQTIAFRANSDLYALDSRGQWAHSVWDSGLRSEVLDHLERVMPWLCGPIRITPHFGDGLFWQSDRDVYGIDPRTARVANSIRIPNGKIVFGSHVMQWGLVLDRDHTGGIARIIDLKSGCPRFNVETNLVNNPSSLARSAHGHLLAISGEISNYVLVLDMHHDKPLVVLRAPADYAIQATAFSWNGDQLWLYAQHKMDRRLRKMLIWDLPASTLDPAEGTQVPDQLRFDGPDSSN